MPTVPVRASCVPLAGQAACIAALGSGALDCGGSGCGGLGRGVLTCAVCTDDVVRGFWRGASTVTCGNGGTFGCCCAGVAGDGDASGSVAGASGAGVPGGDGDSSDCVVPCSAGGDAWARTSLALAAASAR